MFHPRHRRHHHLHLLRWQALRPIRHGVFGAALILLGIGHLLAGQGLIARHELWLIAPLVIALSAAVRLAVAPGLESVLRAGARLLLAAYLVVVIEHLGGWTFAATWPVLLIAAGTATVAGALVRGRGRQEPNW